MDFELIGKMAGSYCVLALLDPFSVGLLIFCSVTKAL